MLSAHVTLPDMPSTSSQTIQRVRKSPQERRREILDAAVKLISERGFNGISVQDVADEVGISKQGLLRYVGNKDRLLSLVYEEYYNTSGTPEDFFASELPGSNADAPHFPAYLRFLVRHNSHRRMMVQLFAVLQAESFNPAHPLHTAFENRLDGIWERYSQYPWNIPPELRPWDDHMRPIVRRAMESMDGIQIRWLRNPPIDLYDEWLEFEKMIFPSPLWDNFR